MPKRNIIREKDFSFSFPLDVYKDKEENWRIKGLASTEDKDLQGEIIKQNGLDISALTSGKGYINWEHKNDPSNIVGLIDNANISKEGLMVEGQLFKKHDQAKAIHQILDSLDKSRKHRIQMSVEGKVIEKADSEDDDGKTKIISRAKISAVALTMNPVNEKTYAELCKSLTRDISYEDNENLGSAACAGEGLNPPSLAGTKTDVEVKSDNDNSEETAKAPVEEVAPIIKEEEAKPIVEQKVVEPVAVVDDKNDKEVVDEEEVKIIENNDLLKVEAAPENKDPVIVKSEGISASDGREALEYLKDKLAKSDKDAITVLKSLKNKLVKSASIDFSSVDGVNAESVSQLFNSLRDTVANSHAYDDLSKFSKLKSHLDKSLEDEDADRLKKLQSIFLTWHDKLHQSGDARYAELSNKLKEFAVSLNVLIDGLVKKQKELDERFEGEEEKKSINEVKDLIKARVKKKVKKDGSIEAAATEIQGDDMRHAISDLKNIIKTRVKKKAGLKAKKGWM